MFMSIPDHLKPDWSEVAQVASDETRIVLVPPRTWRSEEGAVLALLQGGGVALSVAEEQAMDSYNSTVCCTMDLTREQAVALCRWLTDAGFGG
jgi:hypothetical protein